MPSRSHLLDARFTQTRSKLVESGNIFPPVSTVAQQQPDPSSSPPMFQIDPIAFLAHVPGRQLLQLVQQPCASSSSLKPATGSNEVFDYHQRHQDVLKEKNEFEPSARWGGYDDDESGDAVWLLLNQQQQQHHQIESMSSNRSAEDEMWVEGSRTAMPDSHQFMIDAGLTNIILDEQPPESPPSASTQSSAYASVCSTSSPSINVTAESNHDHHLAEHQARNNELDVCHGEDADTDDDLDDVSMDVGASIASGSLCGALEDVSVVPSVHQPADENLTALAESNPVYPSTSASSASDHTDLNENDSEVTTTDLLDQLGDVFDSSSDDQSSPQADLDLNTESDYQGPSSSSPSMNSLSFAPSSSTSDNTILSTTEFRSVPACFSARRTRPAQPTEMRPVTRFESALARKTPSIRRLHRARLAAPADTLWVPPSLAVGQKAESTAASVLLCPDRKQEEVCDFLGSCDVIEIFTCRVC